MLEILYHADGNGITLADDPLLDTEDKSQISTDVTPNMKTAIDVVETVATISAATIVLQ